MVAVIVIGNLRPELEDALFGLAELDVGCLLHGDEAFDAARPIEMTPPDDRARPSPELVGSPPRRRRTCPTTVITDILADIITTEAAATRAAGISSVEAAAAIADALAVGKEGKANIAIEAASTKGA